MNIASAFRQNAETPKIPERKIREIFCCESQARARFARTELIRIANDRLSMDSLRPRNSKARMIRTASSLRQAYLVPRFAEIYFPNL